MNHNIWYACYGSNINLNRFLLYIKGGTKDFYGVKVSHQGCTNQKPPIRNMPYQFSNPIYFAKEKNRWGGGVAFLDITKKGVAFGRVYLITIEQFLEIKKQEGAWYNQEVDLGLLEGYQVKTFTGIHHDYCKPSKSYLSTIYDGLLEINMSDFDVNHYLDTWK